MRAKATFGPPAGCKQLSEQGLIWMDPLRQLVVCDGYVALRRGPLEMFACTAGTKEHESIVATFGKASWVHTALLAVGAETGKPVSFEPFRPASGTTIKIYVLWYDAEGVKHAAAAQDWIIHAENKEPMRLDWVFAGSVSVLGPEGEQIYMGDNGDLITVANFPSATLDLAVRSDAANTSLQFMPRTEAIPPENTPVRIVLQVSEEAPRQ